MIRRFQKTLIKAIRFYQQFFQYTPVHTGVHLFCALILSMRRCPVLPVLCIELFPLRFPYIVSCMTIENLIKEYGTYVYSCAWKFSCTPDEADDIFQETFIQAWKNKDELKDENAVKGWLRRICLNCFLMKHRRKDENSVLFADDEQLAENENDRQALERYMPQPEEEVLVDESIREMQNGCFYAMVRRLTLEQRIAFSLVDMFGLTTAETAQLLAATEGAVKAQLFRARMNLDTFFSDHCSVISSANPCSCRAWQEFWQKKYRNKEEMRKQAVQIVPEGTLDWHKKEYHFNPDVRKKIRYLYAHMPDKQPDEKWFKKIIRTVSLPCQTASSV
jgi:RNA polymerase sigma factor (sigma-70 family)